MVRRNGCYEEARGHFEFIEETLSPALSTKFTLAGYHIANVEWLAIQFNSTNQLVLIEFFSFFTYQGELTEDGFNENDDIGEFEEEEMEEDEVTKSNGDVRCSHSF